ncbi:hypothetical protein Bca52824_046086 [Brassica carinata]|uniref:Small ribosomal subunit protein eS4 N-terminal domain-containing protein n=1 Tax=Brassica carinata TaxID=52824 RepID=A0A8X7REU8_BRACI|nr:hypothetical protein Bca52824_046086 [Brassica carinata]
MRPLMNAGRLCISFAKAIGLKKHMKRLNAPKHWMLDKLGGAFYKLCKGVKLTKIEEVRKRLASQQTA